MELAAGIVIGFIIGAGVTLFIFDRLMTRFIKKLTEMEERFD